jgi:hypothetical protein
MKRRCKAVQVTEFDEITCPVLNCAKRPPRQTNHRTYWAAWCDDECGSTQGASSRAEARRLANEENARHERELA